MFPEMKHSYEVWEAHHHHDVHNNHGSDETRRDENSYPPILVEPALPRKTVRYVKAGEQKSDGTRDENDATPF